MGASLVALVFQEWSDLPDRPFRLLLRMALTAKDSDPVPRYFGGHSLLAQAINKPEREQSTYQMISRAVRTLVDAGAIQRVSTEIHPGRQAEFYLLLHRRPVKAAPVVVLPEPPKPSPRVGKARDSNLDDARSRVDGATVTPLHPGRKRTS